MKETSSEGEEQKRTKIVEGKKGTEENERVMERQRGGKKKLSSKGIEGMKGIDRAEEEGSRKERRRIKRWREGKFPRERNRRDEKGGVVGSVENTFAKNAMNERVVESLLHYFNAFFINGITDGNTMANINFLSRE